MELLETSCDIDVLITQTRPVWDCHGTADQARGG